jgi:hypothetical protein
MNSLRVAGEVKFLARSMMLEEAEPFQGSTSSKPRISSSTGASSSSIVISLPDKADDAPDSKGT